MSDIRPRPDHGAVSATAHDLPGALPDLTHMLSKDGARISGGRGSFGRSHDNPIPISGVNGAFHYLAKLTTQHGTRILFHRIGSFTCAVLQRQVDCIECVSEDATAWDLLFFSRHHLKNSRLPPDGFKLDRRKTRVSDIPTCLGTWQLCPNFPMDMGPEILRQFGFSRAQDFAALIAKTTFERPQNHTSRLARLMLDDGPSGA